ncbi:PHP domain-containing protein [Oscillatoria sp. CS-180]|uniref:PHP domain-containing protein n=1 Tax=Oscillatoria sp. CS-180 TaxID=3021720 RepID=UPI00232B111D|nr:PHP domain-containing protein [Oscillatoria sp. CS-180]MDB9526085.1 PHP domain-containing protein [Oscillatoria sp. CS-180]
MVQVPATAGVPTGASARDALELRGVFKTVDESSCPGRLNFHMHTFHSDGQLSPETLIEQAIQLGLQEFAITDHHTVNGYRLAKQYLEDWQWKNPASIRSKGGGKKVNKLPRLWTGVEITSLLNGVEVHILGYAFRPHHKAIRPYIKGHSPRGPEQKAEAVIRAIQRSGGIAVLAHPCRYRRSPEELVVEAARHGIDGIEVYYAYDNPKTWRPCPKKTPSMQQLAHKLNLLQTCGTDTHGKSITRRI